MAEDTNACAAATHAETGSQRAHAALCGVHEERASALRAFHEDLAPPQVRLAQAFVVGQVQRGGAAQVDPGTVRQAQLAAFADARALPGERTEDRPPPRQPAATRGAGQQGERLEQRSAPRTHACQRVQEVSTGSTAHWPCKRSIRSQARRCRGSASSHSRQAWRSPSFGGSAPKRTYQVAAASSTSISSSMVSPAEQQAAGHGANHVVLHGGHRDAQALAGRPVGKPFELYREEHLAGTLAHAVEGEVDGSQGLQDRQSRLRWNVQAPAARPGCPDRPARWRSGGSCRSSAPGRSRSDSARGSRRASALREANTRTKVPWAKSAASWALPRHRRSHCRSRLPCSTRGLPIEAVGHAGRSSCGGWGLAGAWQFTTLMIMSLILFTPEAELQLRMRSPGSAPFGAQHGSKRPQVRLPRSPPPMETQP